MLCNATCPKLSQSKVAAFFHFVSFLTYAVLISPFFFLFLSSADLLMKELKLW